MHSITYVIYIKPKIFIFRYFVLFFGGREGSKEEILNRKRERLTI